MAALGARSPAPRAPRAGGHLLSRNSALSGAHQLAAFPATRSVLTPGRPSAALSSLRSNPFRCRPPAPLLSPARPRGPAPARAILPVDPWAPGVDSQSIASSLFAVSLFPYLGFLFFLTRSGTAPRATLFGFYFLLAFVGATIPAGIYAKIHYGTSLSNVDYLHGSAESLLTVTNLLIVLGLRDALRKAAEVDGKGKAEKEVATATSEDSQK